MHGHGMPCQQLGDGVAQQRQAKPVRLDALMPQRRQLDGRQAGVEPAACACRQLSRQHFRHDFQNGLSAVCHLQRAGILPGDKRRDRMAGHIKERHAVHLDGKKNALDPLLPMRLKNDFPQKLCQGYKINFTAAVFSHGKA